MEETSVMIPDSSIIHVIQIAKLRFDIAFFIFDNELNILRFGKSEENSVSESFQYATLRLKRN